MKNLEIYRLIGKIHSTINSSQNSDEALKASLKLIVEAGSANYAVLWYKNKTDNILHPYYWICPNDLSGITLSFNEGIVSKVMGTKETVVSNNLEKDDTKLFTDLSKLSVKSGVFSPISINSETPSLISVFKKNDQFDDDEKEFYNIISLLIETYIKEAFVNPGWEAKRKIMTVSDVTKTFKNGPIETQVLKGINFDIYEGEFLCLLGESGCGKSTLLNLLGAMDTPTTGEIKFENNSMSNATENQLTEHRRNNVGFIFQNYNLMPNLTAKENLDLIGELVENPLNSVDALKLVGLEDKKNNYPSQLSGGQQQRIAIARALVKNPKIIMADEPTAALDYTTSIEVLEALENAVKNKTTLVMVTHNEEISKMANRIIRFRDGKIYEITINNNIKKAKDLVW